MRLSSKSGSELRVNALPASSTEYPGGNDPPQLHPLPSAQNFFGKGIILIYYPECGDKKD